MSCLLRARDPSRISSPLSIIQPLSFLDETPLTGTHTRHCTRVNGKSTMQRPVCMSQAIYPPCVGVAAACVRHPRDHVASFCPTYEKGSLKKTLYVWITVYVYPFPFVFVFFFCDSIILRVSTRGDFATNGTLTSTRVDGVAFRVRGRRMHGYKKKKKWKCLYQGADTERWKKTASRAFYFSLLMVIWYTLHYAYNYTVFSSCLSSLQAENETQKTTRRTVVCLFVCRET